MRTPQEIPARMPRRSRRLRVWLLVIVVALIVAASLLRGLARFWINYLWFESVGFTSVFRGVLLTKVALSVIFIAIFFVLMLVNLTVADRYAPVELDPSEANELVLRYRESVLPRAKWVRLAVSFIFALLAGTGADREWNNWDLFRYGGSFGVKDPQFHRDIGFYVFRLPFIEFLIGWAFEAVIVTLIVTAVAHYLNGGILPQARGARRTSPAVKAHVSVLLTALALIKGVDYYYQRLELVLSRAHIVDGATATSVHADLPARTLLMFIAVLAAVLFIANIRARGWVLPAVGVALWGLVSLLIGDAYPALYQALRVNPSELTREAPYIQRNIDATRAAYGLDQVKVDTGYQYQPTVTTSQIQGDTQQAMDDQATLANVRLMDPGVTNLLNTFNKYQALRSYYSFNSLSPDRYVMDINGKPEKVATITAVRELNSNVPSGFVNQKLQYTHGYGAVVAPVSQNGFNSDGTPNFVLSGLPPQTSQPSLSLSATGSEIYFGDGPDMTGFVIADSKTPELDYESNSGQQISNHYSGRGGVPAGSLVRRAAFALAFGDANFILSGQVTPSSKVLFYRNIVTRVQKAAPFLRYDSDPYAVVIDGKVYWIIDAYTISDNYPYSQQANLDRLPATSGLDTNFNYVRNSVKVVVSAFSGQMHFFDMGTQDPVLKAYERAFPDLFTPVSQADKIIPGITAHFRYPEDLFRVQTNMYGRYHLTNAADFYSQAQAWAVSPDPGSGELSATNSLNPTVSLTGQPAPVARLQPQYVLAHIPGSSQPLSFMLITPYVPISASTASQNLVSFMTASYDPSGPPGQPRLEVFETPAGETVDGPGLISNAIKTNQAISQELTLYDQKGSQVELGEVETIPLASTLLYVQPVYVESTSNQIPTLRDVVVVYNGTAYHSGNASLDAALCQITNGPGSSQPFSSYCNTQAALSEPPSSPVSVSPNQHSSIPTTSTTTSTTTPAANQSVSALLAQAQSEFSQAQSALQSGNLGAYQADVQAAQADVAEARKLLSSAGSQSGTG